MKKGNDEIKGANRKALPRFLLILAVAILLGGVLGFAGGMLEDGLKLAMESLNQVLVRYVAPAAIWVWLVVALLVVLPMYRKSRRQAESWDGEDEGVSEAIEVRLSKAMWLASTLMILSLLSLTVTYAGGFHHIGVVGVSIGGFIIHMAVLILLQQRMVDLTRRMNPEKRGSVYEFNFQKTWLNSCDEAERALIGQCAYKAYYAVQLTCAALWMVFTLSAMFFSTGYLPVLAVCIIWAVMQGVYCYWSIKLSARGGAPL